MVDLGIVSEVERPLWEASNGAGAGSSAEWDPLSEVTWTTRRNMFRTSLWLIRT